ncbi:MAG: N-acyl-D-amino-acid deacylase family protein [Vicinamibacteria bacterium]
MNRRSFLRKAGAAVVLGFPGIRKAQKQQDFDLVLQGGAVLDGSGAEARVQDVGVRGHRIAALGSLEGTIARRTLDVRGLTVTPGFVDVHSHSEEELLTNPRAESKIRQGVTTEILGMDGGSYEPAAFAEELRKLEERRLALNAGSFVGQGTLRGLVMGVSNRAATGEEIARMRELAAFALQKGALGISSGLEYTPGGFASSSEIAELCKVMSGGHGLYATHMRNEDDRVLEAVEEAVAIAEGASVGLHISHLKCQGKRNWHKLDAIFDAISKAESRGVSVTMDRYPYIAYSTTLANLMPLWSREGGAEAFLSRLQSPETWERIRKAMEEKIELLGSWDAVMISSVKLEKNKALQGKTIAEIVKANGEDPFLYTRALLVEERNQVGMVGFGMEEETTARVLAHPKCMPASDAAALADYGELRAGNPHPRAYGTFARLLGKYVREEKIMTLAEAVRKMTSLPAERFALQKRGRIAEGFFADIAVFDSEKVQDRATFAEPHQYAEGFELVLVNGKIVLETGERTDDLPGTVIRGDLMPAV